MVPNDAANESSVPPSRLVADVAVDGAFAGGGLGILTYSVPAELSLRVGVGQLVWVPIRKNTSLGLVVSMEQRSDAIPLKPIRTPVEPAFALDATQIDTV